MDNQIFQGATKEEAISNAEKALNKDRKFLLIKILEEPEKKTIFNILDKTNVKIEVSVNKEKEQLISKMKKNKTVRKNRLKDDELNKNKEILTTFLDKFIKQNLDIELEYSLNEKDKDFHIDFNASNNAKLIGTEGTTLDALQIYIQQVLNLNIKPTANIYIDASGYKERKVESLKKQAEETAFKIRQTGNEHEFPAMRSFYRKVLHNSFLNFPDLNTKSIGEEPNRRVVAFMAYEEQ